MLCQSKAVTPGRTSTTADLPGFTLVELLVVIAIIGTLVGLLLPAVQTARETARRSDCQNRMKQLALGMINFVDARGRFPMNMGCESTKTPCPWTAYPDSNKGRSWISEVLPFVERSDVYTKISFDSKTFAQNAGAYSLGLPELRCASDPSPSVRSDNYGRTGSGSPFTGSYGVTNYKSVAGGNSDQAPFSIYFLCGQSRWCVKGGGWNGGDNGNGVACRNYYNDRNNFTYMRSIKDGTSKTLAIGESVPDWMGCSMWGHFGGAWATCGYPINYRVEQGESFMVANRASGTPVYPSFFSRHPGGGSFALCDGSVSWISNSIDTALYSALAAIDGAGDSGANLPSGIAVSKSIR
jgi:prepilin-type N-terminal cleavage/methylation domain-containing protein/prepilin-type processing-associated H-X9-DG protein